MSEDKSKVRNPPYDVKIMNVLIEATDIFKALKNRSLELSLSFACCSFALYEQVLPSFKNVFSIPLDACFLLV